MNELVPIPEIDNPAVDNWIIQNWGKQFETPHEMTKLAREYFTAVPVVEWAINGVCVYLGISRQKLTALCRNTEYQEPAQLIKTRLEFAMEKRNIMRGNSGDQFALKMVGWDPNPAPEVHRQVDLTNLSDDELEEYIATSA